MNTPNLNNNIFIRAYPTRIQAEAFIDGLNSANTNYSYVLNNIWEIIEVKDKFSPTFYWYQVFQKR